MSILYLRTSEERFFYQSCPKIWKKWHFYFLLNARHHTKFRKKSKQQIFLNVCVFAFLGPKMSPSLKLQSLHPFFNTCHQEQFQKNLKNRLRKNSKFDLFINLLNLLIFFFFFWEGRGQNWPIYSILNILRVFIFTHPMPVIRNVFKKHYLISRWVQTVDFGPKNTTFTPFWA